MIDGSGGCWAEWIMLFVRAQTTQVTQLLSVTGLSAKNYVCAKLCAQREGLCTHMPCRSSCGLGRGFCEVCSAPCSGVILSAVIIRPQAVLVAVVDVLNLALSFSELDELLQSPTLWKQMSEWLSWADPRRWVWIFYDS